MSAPERPMVTPVGNMHDLLAGGACSSGTSYQVGDYVWATNTPDGSGTRWLAHVESAHSVRSFSGRRWRVRVRRTKFWTSGDMFMYVHAGLTLEQLIHNRKLGLIPPAGERP